MLRTCCFGSGRARGADRVRGTQSLAGRILDSFARLELQPPVGEGFDLASGRPTTYRGFRGKPAVYLRSLADACGGTLKAWECETVGA